MKEIYVLGIGGSSPLFVDLAGACGYTIKGFYHYNDTRTGEIDHGYEILGSFEDLYKTNIKDKNFILSMGDMQIRRDVSEKLLSLGANIPTMIHPTAQISRFTEVSPVGVLIGAGCVIQADDKICSHAVIRDMALVCHQTVIGEYCFVGPKALIGAHITLKELSFIGQGSILISGKVGEVGEKSLVGAGSVVTKPVPDNCVVVGFPAKHRS